MSMHKEGHMAMYCKLHHMKDIRRLSSSCCQAFDRQWSRCQCTRRGIGQLQCTASCIISRTRGDCQALDRQGSRCQCTKWEIWQSTASCIILRTSGDYQALDRQESRCQCTRRGI